MAECASAIIGLVVVGITVGNKLNGLIESLKDAPAELRDLSAEVTQFSTTLNKLQEINGKRLLDDVDLDSLCAHCSECLSEVEGFVQGLSESDLRGGLESKVRRVKCLAKGKRAKRLREIIQWQRSSVTNLIVSGTL